MEGRFNLIGSGLGDGVKMKDEGSGSPSLVSVPAEESASIEMTTMGALLILIVFIVNLLCIDFSEGFRFCWSFEGRCHNSFSGFDDSR